MFYEESELIYGRLDTTGHFLGISACHCSIWIDWTAKIEEIIGHLKRRTQGVLVAGELCISD